MAQDRKDPALDLGVYGRKEGSSVSAAEIVAGLLTLVWLFAVGVFFFVMGGWQAVANDALGYLMTFMGVVLPIAMIWIAATVAKTSRIMREESARLQTAIDAMRQAYVTQQQTAGFAIKPSVEKKLDEIAAAQKKTETVIATFTTRRDGPAAAPPPQDSGEKAALARTRQPDGDRQASLALGTGEEYRAPISVSEFIRALNFPENEKDKEGFRTLRRALEDRETSRLVRAAQDVLTLLSQDGIYMDDLNPDRARPEIWRKFAQGERGRSIAALGGIRDRSSLALASGRMKNDPVFRDAVHHFLRQFDRTFAAFEGNASDQEIAGLANTRTARAFMLLGRVTGTFD